MLTSFFLFPVDESLFVKLSSSPAHRRTVALAILSAQSSLEDSSSVASRSRSVSPLRSHRHDDALLIGLSTGLFDANNPKVSIAYGTPLYLVWVSVCYICHTILSIFFLLQVSSNQLKISKMFDILWLNGIIILNQKTESVPIIRYVIFCEICQLWLPKICR